jgi:molecular chaperone Hsp33
MADGVVRAIMQGNLKVVVVVATDTARDARRRHGLKRASASLLAQGLTGGLLMASLQKGDSRINLQLECDGPLGGFFVDASAEGNCRGYAKNADADVELEGAFRWRAALGNSGFLSVLRDIGTEYYRSSVQLEAMDVAGDLDHYFVTSEQVATRVALDVRRTPEEPLGVVAGVLVQALPDGEVKVLEQHGEKLAARLTQALEEGAGSSPRALLEHLFPGVHVLLELPVAFTCTCSKERVLRTMGSLGARELQDIVDTMGSTAVTCQFCGTRHEVTLPDLLELLERLGVPQARG